MIVEAFNSKNYDGLLQLLGKHEKDLVKKSDTATVLIIQDSLLYVPNVSNYRVGLIYYE